MRVRSDTKRIASRDPANGEPIVEMPSDSIQDVNNRVACARNAFEMWRSTGLPERLKVIRSLHDVLSAEAVRTASALSRETGRPIQESLGAEILPTLASLDFLIKRAPVLLKPQTLRAAGARAYAEPYGVVGIIGAWNYPLFLNLVPLCQALAAGNTVVWKPSELALYSALETQRLLEQAGVPPGVVEIAYGDGQTGQALARAECDKYVFTGGVRTGRSILADLAETGKPAVMELSGNDAFIVCHDAPLELAARTAVWARICNAGQSCVAPQRFYVAHSIYEPFLALVKANLEALQPHELTPLRTQAARERCHHLVRHAIEHGARLLHGGDFRPDDPGFFYQPALLAECDDSLPVMAEDLFGPVIAVCPFLDEKVAIARANANPMALGASIWSRDLKRAADLAAQLQVGLVSVNDALMDAAHPAIPFGGMRASGFGKQRGAAGLESFVVRKVIVQHGPGGSRRHLFPYLPAATELLTAAARMRRPSGWREIPNLVRAAMDWRKQEQG